MPQDTSKRTVGTGHVELRDIEHIRVHYDENLYLCATNRGGIWNFGDGELAVAYLAYPMDYKAELPAGLTRHVGGARAFRGRHERWGDQSGVMLSRSLDGGQTWPESERQWIWHNNRSVDEIIDWLRPMPAVKREQIDMGDPNAIIHFCHGEYLKHPIGDYPFEALGEAFNFHLGRRDHHVSLALRSADRGRTWESHASVIDGPQWAGKEAGMLTVNMGYVRFDNGVLGIAGGIYRRNIISFYASYDNGATWEYISDIARTKHCEPGKGSRLLGWTYAGLHRLPDGRLMCSMHQSPPEMPCVTFSCDDGMTWSEIQYVCSPGTFCGSVTGPLSERALLDDTHGDSVRQRSPVAIVTSQGRIVVIYARRRPVRGARGIIGVVSDDLGATWSDEFVIRGDAYCWDLGYPVITEMPDGRLFAAYWFNTKESDQPIPEAQVVRYIAGTFFRLD